MIAAALIAFALARTPLDSQVVLDRYAARLLSLEAPKAMVFSYNVSQAGPHVIEQTHREYRSGEMVRDETLTVDGQPLRPKVTRIARYRNHYTLDGLAPRLSQYAFLFMRSYRSGNSYQYEYRAEAIAAAGNFVIDGMTIDGRSFLPSLIRFHTTNGSIEGTGSVTFAKDGKYWLPIAANVAATIDGKPARERITFSGYQFPGSLPKSTFQAPKPLPTPTLPAF